MADWFFQECIEAGKESLLIDAIQSGEIGIEDRDCIDRTPLMVALEMGRSSLVKTLLGLGASPDAKSDDGGTCLSRAIDAGDAESLELLLEQGADIELASSGCHSPLALAAARGRVEMIEQLLRRGANIEARGEMEETPLIEACYFGQAEAVTVLLQHGANRLATDAFGQSAMDIAREHGGPAVVAALSNKALDRDRGR